MTQLHPARLLVLAQLALFACADGGPQPAPDPLGPRGVTVVAHRILAEGSDASHAEVWEEPAVGAWAVITAEGSTWRVEEPTPADVALAPGAYTVAVEARADGQLLQAEPQRVEVGEGWSQVHASLCPAVGGGWVCAEDGGEAWEAEVTQSGCAVSCEALGLDGRLIGNLVEGEGLKGFVTADGDGLELARRDVPLSCLRR